MRLMGGLLKMGSGDWEWKCGEVAGTEGSIAYEESGWVLRAVVIRGSVGGSGLGISLGGVRLLDVGAG